MKTSKYAINLLSICVVFIVTLASCDCGKSQAEKDREWNARVEERRKETRKYDFLFEPRTLRKMFVDETKINERTTNSHGGFVYFIFGARASSSTTEKTRTYSEVTVTFAWERNPGEYIVTTLPLELFRYQIHNTDEAPKIRFEMKNPDKEGMQTRYNGCVEAFYTDPNDYFKRDRGYYGKTLTAVTLIINEKDWPAQIKIPLNK